MTGQAAARVIQMEEGEVLALRAPVPAELVIKVDAERTGSPFTMVTEALGPGVDMPRHRLLSRDRVAFTYKGQGRAITAGRPITLVPGTTIHVPRGTWVSLSNTGTGVLRLVWVVSPGGLEAYYRELAGLGSSPDPSAVGQLAQRHSIELEIGERISAPRARRGRPRPRRRRGPQSQAAPAPSQQPTTEQQAAAPVLPAGGSSQPTVQAPRRRRRRRRAGRGSSQAQRPGASVHPQGPTPQAPSAAPREPTRGRRPPRVKEVYMGGRWVQVSGEGPVIAPGSSRPMRRRPNRPQ